MAYSGVVRQCVIFFAKNVFGLEQAKKVFGLEQNGAWLLAEWCVSVSGLAWL